jgi:hypothetical protein
VSPSDAGIGQHLLDDLRRAYAGDAWHGPALTTVLRDVPGSAAAARPIAHGHSIWEIVLHLTSWTREVTRRLRGASPRAPVEGDWPEVGEPGDWSWLAAREALAEAQRDAEAAVAAFDPGRWQEPVGGERDAPLGSGVTFAVMVSGLAQHHAYHGGQIALLRKGVLPAAP